MAPVDRSKSTLLFKMLAESRRRRRFWENGIAVVLQQRQLMLKALLLAIMLLVSDNGERKSYIRSTRRVPRNTGWWQMVSSSYDDKRFKQTFRVSRKTFDFILCKIRHKLERQTVCEEPISAEFRLAICLYRLGRGDYLYSIAEMAGLGRSTVTTIVNEVTEAIVKCLWTECISVHMPKTENEFKEKILDMEELWQFPFSWAAVDGCHIPIKCPPGGANARKEYHNFKNFYSIILMALVDARYRFIWGSCGFPGNSHDSIILQSTSLWSAISNGQLLPDFTHEEQRLSVPPLILGDSAFPLETFLMKPYTNAVLTKEQRYFNYRLSRARMIVEGAYGQLKGRWRFLLRKSESNFQETKLAVLSCMILHNICLDQGDTLSRKLDISIDARTNQKRDRETIRNMLLMKSNAKSCKSKNSGAIKIRDVIKNKLWKEFENSKQTFGTESDYKHTL